MKFSLLRTFAPPPQTHKPSHATRSAASSYVTVTKVHDALSCCDIRAQVMRITNCSYSSSLSICQLQLMAPWEVGRHCTVYRDIVTQFLQGSEGHYCTLVTWSTTFNALLATAWTVRGSNPGCGEIFRTRPDWLWGPPSPLYSGYRVFPGGKAAEAWRWPPHPVSRLKKE